MAPPHLASRFVLGSSEEFVGRADELAQVTEVLAATGQVTVVGGPGIGKSTLGREVARGVDDEMAVAMCRLGDLGAAAPVTPAIAAACGVPEQPALPLIDALAMTLAGRDILLVLDGADVVGDEVAVIVDRLRLECARLRVLVTSRAPVRCRAETVVRLEPLDDIAAAELVRLHAGSGVTDEDASSLVAALGGIPLALVVGARALASGGAPVEAGRDAVAGAVGAAVGALEADARRVLALAAVLPGGAPGDVLRAHGPLDVLVDAGLVSVEGGRHRLPDPVRDVVTSLLTVAEVAGAVAEQRLWLQDLVDAVQSARTPGEERLRLDAAERELANVAAAITHACDGAEVDAVDGARLAMGAVQVWLARARFSDGAGLVDIARRRPTPHRARLTYYAGALAHVAGRVADASVAFADAEREAAETGDAAALALASAGRSTLSFLLGDRATAAELAAVASEAAARADDPAAGLMVAAARGTLARITGDVDAAEVAYADAVALARAAGDYRGMTIALLGAGSVAQLRGAHDDAHARFVEARDVAEAAGHPAQLAVALGVLGALAEGRGDLDESRRLLRESLAAAEAAGPSHAARDAREPGRL